ncbi:MAG: folate-binding protein YgfZ [Rhizobiales bacterium]|nr:folate-binding protein YgfZ [Hyphomicrobiales bacterium]MBI3674662.1 folate-binding protein YgfZ [Hyphomicrobiales bacterium]
MHSATFHGGSLTGRSALRVDGAEARHFLHNLLTADIEALKAGEATYAALLTPQGKILFDMFVYDAGDGFLIDCAASQIADLAKRLGFYRLRAKIGIAVADGLEVGVAPHEAQTALRYPDPREPALGWRLFVPKGVMPQAQGYDAARIAAGLADSDADLGSGEFFPHEANLDQLGGVSFEKGCYIGQEVVSRMEHRGTARARILPVALGGPAPQKGADIRSGEKSVGTLLSSSGSRALAHLRLDRLAEASEPLLTQGVSVEVLKPAFVGYDVPGARIPD